MVDSIKSARCTYVPAAEIAIERCVLRIEWPIWLPPAPYCSKRNLAATIKSKNHMLLNLAFISCKQHQLDNQRWVNNIHRFSLSKTWLHRLINIFNMKFILNNLSQTKIFIIILHNTTTPLIIINLKSRSIPQRLATADKCPAWIKKKEGGGGGLPCLCYKNEIIPYQIHSLVS